MNEIPLQVLLRHSLGGGAYMAAVLVVTKVSFLKGTKLSLFVIATVSVRHEATG